MQKVAIKVIGVGKKYNISHDISDPYKRLTDSIIDNIKLIFKPWKLINKKSSEVFHALDDINFEINKGDKIAIIGRNGAGKSTLLKILSRITEPSEGEIRIKGRVASLLEVGTGFHPELTGRENIFLNGSILGMSSKEIKTKFDDIVAFSGCEKFLDTPVKRYSSGMRVRLGFAIAAHLESEILIVDEVLAVGDAEFQRKCLGKMDEISKGEGRTIIFVSHNMSAVQELCEKAIYLKDGKIEDIGDSQDIVSKYMYSDSTYTLLNKSNNVIEFSLRTEYKSKNRVQQKIILDLSDDIYNVFVDFIIFNEKNDKLCHCRMSRENLLHLKKGVNNISLNVGIDSLPSGKYYMKIMVSNKNKTDIVLHLDNHLSFELDGINKDSNLINLSFGTELN